jgi:flagellar biogenesis protein FliO
LVAIALALGAIGLTEPALADADGPTAPAPSVESATPLTLRPSKPLDLAQEPQHAGIGWKLFALAAILGCAGFYFRKRFQFKGAPDTGLTIVRRAPVGIRSELLIVSVEGQRLLIGVTPHTIQSLAVLDSDEPAVEASSTPLGERFSAMLESAEKRADAAPRAAPATPFQPAPPAEEAPEDVAGQARGLLALRRRR